MLTKKTDKFSLKDELFNPYKVEKIASEIQAVHHVFEVEYFVTDVLQLFPKLELKERIYHIRDMLHKYLPDDYREAAQILLDALPPELDPENKDDDFGDFIYAPYSDFVACYGCSDTHLDFSLNALREMTKRFSVEYAIRDFINIYPDETLVVLGRCAMSENYHERRLVSEGLRPRLPWAKRLTLDYKKPIKHLDSLFYDNTRYVTRSVANHLNDIAKIDAPLVIETLERWKSLGKQNSKEMDFIIKHALRTLVKKGNQDALALLGYQRNPYIKVGEILLHNADISIGEVLLFSVRIEAKEDTRLMVDYLIHFKTKRDTWSSKVHKLKSFTLQKGESIILEKRHPFKANMSTRKLYAGVHKIEVQINGKVYRSDTFMLKT